MKTTHFGFQRVKSEDKAARVADVFDSVAGRYDLISPAGWAKAVKSSWRISTTACLLWDASAF